MTISFEGNVKVLKLADCSGAIGQDQDARAMLRIWQLLSGGHAMRDGGLFNRSL
jgi:hypothetical protein